MSIYKITKPEPRICEGCGKEFVPNTGKQVCCSEKCNVKKWRNKNPEKAKEAQKRADEKRKGVNRYNSETRKKWYREKRQDKDWVRKINQQYIERRNKIQEFIRRYKILKGCKDCGYKGHHAALEFDHINGDKEINVCNAKSINQAKREIRKCDVVCANCHRIRTFGKL